MSQTPFTSQVKNSLNAVLNPIGLQMQTTVAERREIARLKRVEQRGQWSRAPYAEGLDFKDPEYLQFLETVCKPRQERYSAFPRKSDVGQGGYFLENIWFGAVDAEVLYCVIDHFRPRTIIEVGSGYSTRLMRRAIQGGQVGTRLISIDPAPRVEIQSSADEEIRAVVEDVPVSRFTDELQPNDILFVDSSHVIQTGGDVPYLFLEVFPKLQAGVLIHVHDIFLPFDYPKCFVDERWGWTEQYLFHAFMLNNPNYATLWPSYYMWQQHRQAVTNVIGADAPLRDPSSFWIQKLSSQRGGQR
jgi:hypothetical protein